METQVKTPRQVFNLPQYLDVPLFQRPYVWDEELQWSPLWEDIRRVTELRMASAPEATHFLGAIVMQEVSGSGMGDAETYSLIDGQQRLTTLQLFMDAVAAELEGFDHGRLARQLTSLTHNSEDFGFEGRARLKVRHGNKDGAAFANVMMAEPPIDYSTLGEARLVRAHAYFAAQAREWIQAGGEDSLPTRAEALAKALMQGIQLVVITLSPQENSQEIFETLNARGTPLTAGDLIKNLIFQRLALEGVDTSKAYQDHWRFFENPFWEKEISLGRYAVERVSLFLNHWLVAQVGEEVSTRSTYTRFKRWAEHETGQSMADILSQLHGAATAYQEWIEGASTRTGVLSRQELFFYRTQASDSEAVKPVLLRLADPLRPIPDDVASTVLSLVESWVVRRALLNLSASDVSRLVVALVTEIDDGATNGAAERVERFLASQERPGTYWPGDEEVRKHLGTAPVYRAMRRGRLRMLLEAIEDHHRGFGSRGRQWSSAPVERDHLHIEHVMPQRWRSHWAVEDLAAEIERDGHVHRLGNLTLLTKGLNSGVSNAGWLKKREALREHDTLLMSRPLRDEPIWDEATIDQRSSEMAGALIETWPVPEGHAPEVTAKKGDSASDWVEIRDLLASGHLEVGTELHGREGARGTATAVIQPGGTLRSDGKDFGSPSGAGRHHLQRSTNGWQYWRLPNGRKLAEVKNDFLRQRAGGEGGLSVTQANNEALWRLVLDRIHEEHPSWSQAQVAPKESWISLPYGSSYISYSFSTSAKVPRVELLFGHRDVRLNAAELAEFMKHRELLESRFGGPLSWLELPDRISCRIEVRADHSMDPMDPAEHEAIAEWLISTMARFRPATQEVKDLIEQARFGSDPVQARAPERIA